jgi:FkbM family methyltransferase
MTAIARLLRKTRSVLTSDLCSRDKVRYTGDLIREKFFGAASNHARTFQLSDGSRVFLRANSTDPKVFDEVFIDRIYAPYAEIVGGDAPVALVDLGANIGLSAIFLARKLKVDTIFAVEPDPGNFATLKENLRLAGLEDLCTPIQAFAGTERGFARLVDSGNGAWGMRMGESQSSGISVVPLRDLVNQAKQASPRAKIVLKCDIEGAESHLFRQLLQWEPWVDYIVLELHTEFLSLAEFQACVAASRYNWRVDGHIPEDAILGVIGLQRLALKASPVAAAHGG